MAHNYVAIIKTLKDILTNVEILTDNRERYEELSRYFKIHNMDRNNKSIETILDASVKMAYESNANLIVLYTDNFIYAKTLSKFRPHCRVFCGTNNINVFDYVRLIRGITPFLLEEDFKSITNSKEIDKITLK